MAKKPKEEWQIRVREKLEKMGIGYKELADRISKSSGELMSEGVVRQAMCKNNCPGVQKKICDYLNIKIHKEAI